ncbi:hypothetical protein BX286_4649 [Streptomyces sp. 3211.6]|uniref:hypothetical protein n=1 Tax=Streptomyces sp. 3211.6 TaxID=1938845 RepID=UPI000C2B7C61|nr:hypothetical protein [Streptomyces sp. 3211.6]RKT06605.1 hypothetical protein BX286_4649 [Streptomyces sp. 3211.6]
MKQSTLARLRMRYETRPGRDRGQTAFEYLGIILVVVVIIGAIVGTGIGQAITTKITGAVASITAGK